MGQNCIGIERFIVHSSVYAEFIKIMVDRIGRLRVGPTLVTSPAGEEFGRMVDGGSMINDVRFKALEDLIAAAVEQGAQLHLGGHRKVHPELQGSSYFEPTLLTEVTEDMEIAQEEGQTSRPRRTVCNN